MTGRILTGYRHDLVWQPTSKFSGHIRAVVWGLIVAGILAGVGL